MSNQYEDEKAIAEAIEQTDFFGLEEDEKDTCPALEAAERIADRNAALALKRVGQVALARSYHDRKAYALRDAVLKELRVMSHEEE